MLDRHLKAKAERRRIAKLTGKTYSPIRSTLKPANRCSKGRGYAYLTTTWQIRRALGAQPAVAACIRFPVM
jgi:hypothetical protein